MANTGPAITLSQLIEKTADELRSLKKKPREDAVMQFTGCELELAVTVSTDVGGKIKFLLVDLSGDIKGELVSRIKLNFGPIGPVPISYLKKGIDFGPIVTAISPPRAAVAVPKPPSGKSRRK